MRKFINIVEAAQHVSIEVTDEMVRHIIETDLFVEHGSNVSDAWEHGLLEWTAEQLGLDGINGKPYDEVKHTPEFFKVLKTMLVELASRASKALNEMTPSTPIYRGVARGFRDGEPLGLFWTTSKNTALWFASSGGGKGSVAASTIAHAHVNWSETIKSRLDPTFSDDESEIQLVAGSKMRCAIFDLENKTKHQGQHTV